MAGLGAAVLAAVAAVDCGRNARPSPSLAALPAVPPPPAPAPPPPPPTVISRIALPGNGILTALPGAGNLLALTVDDGVSSEVVRLYTEFAARTGLRMTYFVNGCYPSWTENAPLLRPLVESGQIQLGNHTWSHPDLTRVSKARIADEITRNDQFLTKIYGAQAKPYLRPPYGRHNAAVRAVAADLGYTVTTMWYGSLSDSTVVTEDFIVKMANQYFLPQSIVIGHLNHPAVTHVFDRLLDVIRDRKLRAVTLNDVFDQRAI